MSKPSISRNYCFTVNNYTQKEYTEILAQECEYVVIGKEIGESGTPHLQGFVMYKNQKSLSAVKKIMPRAHLEQAKGTPIQAAQYCKKDGASEERGLAPTGSGKRTDLELVKDVLQTSGKMSDVVMVATSYQSIRMAECILKYKEAPRNWACHVSWFWGGTGSGKSKQAYEDLGEDCYTCLATGKWFEGYDAHDNVLIDDMRKDFMKFHELLRLFDRYALRVECKGGSRQFRARRIIVTSCYHPKDMFDTREDVGQLLRRIDVIRNFPLAETAMSLTLSDDELDKDEHYSLYNSDQEYYKHDEYSDRL